jgi:hypothetical protein
MQGNANLTLGNVLPKPVTLKPKPGFTQAVEEEPEFLDDLFLAMDQAEQKYQQQNELLSPVSTSSGSSNSSNDISPSSYFPHSKKLSPILTVGV